MSAQYTIIDGHNMAFGEFQATVVKYMNDGWQLGTFHKLQSSSWVYHYIQVVYKPPQNNAMTSQSDQISSNTAQ